MGRPLNPELTKYWKISIPATLAGIVEFYLFDRVHNKPKYGERATLIKHLLEQWVADQKTGAVRGDVLTHVRAARAQGGSSLALSELDKAIQLLEAAAQAPQAINEETVSADH